MKYLLVYAVVFISGLVQAQDSQLGTTRSDDLQMKARMDYERRNQKQPQMQKPVDAAPPSVGTLAKPPAPSASGPQKSVTCKNGGEIRELYIEYKGQGCELFYTKQGTPKSQARQNNGKSVCESVFEKMKATIEKSGFTCEQKEN